MNDERRPARWFLLDSDQVQQGPYPLQEMRDRVRSGAVTTDTVVWADGMPDWMPAGEIPALVPPDAAD